MGLIILSPGLWKLELGVYPVGGQRACRFAGTVHLLVARDKQRYWVHLWERRLM